MYLFKAINAGDSFPKSYGTALVEVDIENAAEHAMSGRDAHRNDYIEYVAPAVSASDIIRVYIPEIFRSRMTFTVDPITYCGISFDVFDENTGSIRAVTEAEKDVFGAKANFTSTSAMNFFRAEMPDHTMLDAYNVRYNI